MDNMKFQREEEVFKNGRPARPEYCLLRPGGRDRCGKAERTWEYESTAKGRPACAKRFGEGRERRWQTFSTLHIRSQSGGAQS